MIVLSRDDRAVSESFSGLTVTCRSPAGPTASIVAVIGLLALLLLLLPIAELIVIIKIGSTIGALETIALLILVSLVGAWLVKREGLSLLARMQRDLNAGRVPTDGLIDGVLLLAAGALLLAPGFITDVFGILLLVPPVRFVLRRFLLSRYRTRAELYGDGTRVRSGRFGRIITVVDIEGEPKNEPTRPGEDPPRLGP
jgi:UPF0716 protein FxsA